MINISVCLTYFKSLNLLNLNAALYSLYRQDQSLVDSITILDNDTDDSVEKIRNVLNNINFSVPVYLHSFKHGDATKTHSWSTNTAVRATVTPWVLFTRADYLLDFNLVSRFTDVIRSRPRGWNGFVTGNVFHLTADVETCEQTNWRITGPRELRQFPGVENDYTIIDAGVWLTRRSAFESVNGLDESLIAWGHAQTHFQHKLFEAGVEFVRIPEALFYHPQHSAERDIDLAHQQLKDRGVNLKQMWQRYGSMSPYQ